MAGEGVNKRKKKARPPKRFSGKMQRKLLAVFGVITVALVGLIIRLMYIEHTSGEKYEKKILSQQGYDSTVIPYQRGNITDTKGTILATSVDVYNVILDCKVLNSDKTDIEPDNFRQLWSAFPTVLRKVRSGISCPKRRTASITFS